MIANLAFANQYPKLPVNLLIAPTLKQNAFAYTPSNLPLNKPLLTKQQQTNFHNTFLQRYYYPWSKNNKPTEFSTTANGKHSKPVMCYENSAVQQFEAKPGYNQTYHPNTLKFIESVAAK